VVKNETRELSCGCTLNICHHILKIAYYLLHKQGFVDSKVVTKALDGVGRATSTPVSLVVTTVVRNVLVVNLFYHSYVRGFLLMISIAYDCT